MKIKMAEIYANLLCYFEGDYKKVDTWMNVKNPLLGDVIPLEMVLIGRGRKLLKFIESQLEGNFP